jgi:hypothetical protein
VPRNVTATLNLTPENEAQLAEVLGCTTAQLSTRLAPYASAALVEYVMMFLGQRVFTRGSDMREYRLLLLIQEVMANRIPDEAFVSRLFQSTTSESRVLLRAVMSKYQSQSHAAAQQSIKNVLEKARFYEDGKVWLITIDNTIIVEHLNRALVEVDGTLERVAKHGQSVSTYDVKPASLDALCKTFGVTPPSPPTKAKRGSP